MQGRSKALHQENPHHTRRDTFERITTTHGQLAERQGPTHDKVALRAQCTAKLTPTDFVQDLRTDRAAIDGKNLANTASNLHGLESTESISVLLLEGSQEVTRLDAMMQNLYRCHPAKLHAWLAASRVERSPQRNKDDGTPTVSITTPSIVE